MPLHLYEKIIQRLAWHQAQGHRNIIITRSFDIYMNPWAKQAAINDMIATKLEINEKGLFTGKIVNHSYVGEKKVQALHELLGTDNYTSYAYADSASDRYILAAADYAYWIRNPDEDVESSLVDTKTHKQWKKECGL